MMMMKCGQWHVKLMSQQKSVPLNLPQYKTHSDSMIQKYHQTTRLYHHLCQYLPSINWYAYINLSTHACMYCNILHMSSPPPPFLLIAKKVSKCTCNHRIIIFPCNNYFQVMNATWAHDLYFLFCHQALGSKDYTLSWYLDSMSYLNIWDMPICVLTTTDGHTVTIILTTVFLCYYAPQEENLCYSKICLTLLLKIAASKYACVLGV
jgi:hypothetical protein